MVSPANTEIGLSFSIAPSAAAGIRTLTVKDGFGASNAVTFMVRNPPAVIRSVSPSVWTAGLSTEITITGTGFGSSPSIWVD